MVDRMAAEFLASKVNGRKLKKVVDNGKAI